MTLLSTSSSVMAVETGSSHAAVRLVGIRRATSPQASGTSLEAQERPAADSIWNGTMRCLNSGWQSWAEEPTRAGSGYHTRIVFADGSSLIGEGRTKTLAKLSLAQRLVYTFTEPDL